MSSPSTTRSSFEGININMPAKLRNLVQAPKPEIKFKLNDPRHTYTTMDKLEGVVSITAPVDTSFDELDIEFVGTSRTFVERLTTAAAVSGRSEAFHQFLKLSQPNVWRSLPETGVLEGGKQYDVPFVFVVPQHMLPRICQHRVQNSSVREEHLQLPPTLGDKELADGEVMLDDLAPEMASVRYGIFAKLSKQKLVGDQWRKASIALKAKKLRIIPAVDEHPPVNIDGKDSDYVMRKEKNIKKGVFKGKLGTLVMEAEQPKSLRLQSPTNVEQCRTTTMATVMLRFDPADENSPPPRLGSLTSKLKVATYFASQARSSIPTKSSTLLDLSQGVHAEHLNLSSRCVASVEWTKQTASKPVSIERRDSAMSTASIDVGITPEPSETYKGKSYYTARLLVPITLPTNRAFVPTFHSCLISRVYSLNLHLSLHSAGIGPSMELKLPVQISAEGSSGEQHGQRGSLATVNEEVFEGSDAEDFFRPRTFSAPSEHLVGNSRLDGQVREDAPPGYSFFAPGGQLGAPRVPVY